MINNSLYKSKNLNLVGGNPKYYRGQYVIISFPGEIKKTKINKILSVDRPIKYLVKIDGKFMVLIEEQITSDDRLGTVRTELDFFRQLLVYYDPRERSRSVLARPSNFTLSRRGILNQGVTCYLNATIQLLYSIPELKRIILSDELNPVYPLNFDYLISTPPRGERERYNFFKAEEQIKSNIVLQSLKDLFKLLDSPITEGEDTYIKPGDNLDYMVSTTTLSINRQEDATEALNSAILSKLHESKVPTIISLMELFNFYFIETLICSDGNKKEKNKSQIRDQFGNPAPEYENILILPLTDTIQNSITSFSSPENVDHTKQPLDGWCFELTSPFRALPYTKQIKIVLNPEIRYLIISLKRFYYSEGRLNFNNRKCSVNPLITLGEINFALKGCIYYTGNAEGGHYQYLEFDRTGTNKTPFRLYNDDEVLNNPKITDGIPDNEPFKYSPNATRTDWISIPNPG